MNIPVLLEPTPTGFRASTGAPLNLVAEAATEEQALEMIRREYTLKQIAGVRVVELALPEPDPLIDLVTKMAANPDILDMVDAAVKENRQREAEEDAAEERKKSASAQEPAA